MLRIDRFIQYTLLILFLSVVSSGCGHRSVEDNATTLMVSPTATIESVEFEEGEHISFYYENGSLKHERFSDIYGKLTFTFDTTPVKNLLGFKKAKNARHRLVFHSGNQERITVVSTDMVTCLYHDSASDHPVETSMNQICLDHATDEVQGSRYIVEQGEKIPLNIKNNVQDSSHWALLQDFRLTINSRFKEASEFITHRRLAEHVEKVLRSKLQHANLAEALQKEPCLLFCDERKSNTSIAFFVKDNYKTTVVSLESKDLSIAATYQVNDNRISKIYGHYYGTYNSLGFQYNVATGGEGIKLSTARPLSKRFYATASTASYGSDPSLSGQSPSNSFRRYVSYAKFPDIYGKLSNQIAVDNPKSKWLSPVGMSEVFQDVLIKIDAIATAADYQASQLSSRANSSNSPQINVEIFSFKMLEDENIQEKYNIPWKLHEEAKKMINEENYRKRIKKSTIQEPDGDAVS